MIFILNISVLKHLQCLAKQVTFPKARNELLQDKKVKKNLINLLILPEQNLL